MQKPPDMLDRLKALRAAYGATMTDDQCATLMNDWAWEFRHLGYGLSNKDGGVHGHRAGDNEDVCHDVVMLQDGTYWDALLSAGGASIPSFDPEKPSGKITDATRYWIAPIEPFVGPLPPPKPPPPPPIKSRAQFAQEFVAVNQFYMSMAGLQRIGGMVLDGRADTQAMIEWGYRLMTGSTLEEVLTAIRASHEWQTKHPTG